MSEANDWSSAAKELETALALGPDQRFNAKLGWLYVTDTLAADFSSLVTYLRQTTGVDSWVGSVGMGVCWQDGAGQSGEAFGRAAAVAMISEHPTGSYHILPRLCKSTSEISGDTRGWIVATNPPLGVVHGDPMNETMSTLIEALSTEIENTTLEVPGFLVGGLSSSRGAHYHLAGEVMSGGLSGVLFAPEVEVATGLTQGYSPVGLAHRITDCVENVVITLNGESALKVFKNDIGELLTKDLSRIGGYIHAAFPIAGSDTGDYTVQNLVGIDSERGWLAIGGNIDLGDQLMFVRRDPEGAYEDLVRMVTELSNRLSKPPLGGLYFSCLARGPNLFGNEGREMEIIGEILNDIPVVGFFGQGEISNNRLYGYTGVLALFL